MAAIDAVRAFISYAHDDEEHKQRVLRLWTLLRDEGIDAKLDRPAESDRPFWPDWTAQQFRSAKYVLVVASPQYRERAENDSSSPVGRGVRHEASLMKELLYAEGNEGRQKLIPVVLPGRDVTELPDWLLPAGSTVFRLDSLTPAGVDGLIRAMTGQPRFVEPPLGRLRPRPPESLRFRPEPKTGRRGPVIFVALLVLLVFAPAYPTGSSADAGDVAVARPSSPSSPSSPQNRSHPADRKPVPSVTPTPESGISPSTRHTPPTRKPSTVPSSTSPTAAPTTTAAQIACPGRHVPEADKVFRPGGEAFTVADFHPVVDEQDPAAGQPRMRVLGDHLVGENGAILGLRHGVPEPERLNCDASGTPFAARLPLTGIGNGDVIVARTAEYVGKLEITGAGQGTLFARTTSYFMPHDPTGRSAAFRG